MESKSALSSKTVWVGILTTAAATLGFLQGQEFIVQYPKAVAGIGAAVGLLTIVLRFMTTVPIK
ncbi:MAG: hypothetical protein E6Q97_38255 [Desulfurellales bacterium]|nr:MAG: hypothetical protein E6Q97_38255 [Desulfurellales bacterium]